MFMDGVGGCICRMHSRTHATPTPMVRSQFFCSKHWNYGNENGIPFRALIRVYGRTPATGGRGDLLLGYARSVSDLE